MALRQTEFVPFDEGTENPALRVQCPEKLAACKTGNIDLWAGLSGGWLYLSRCFFYRRGSVVERVGLVRPFKLVRFLTSRSGQISHIEETIRHGRKRL
jgi:hypothetical protein